MFDLCASQLFFQLVQCCGMGRPQIEPCTSAEIFQVWSCVSTGWVARRSSPVQGGMAPEEALFASAEGFLLCRVLFPPVFIGARRYFVGFPAVAVAGTTWKLLEGLSGAAANVSGCYWLPGPSAEGLSSRSFWARCTFAVCDGQILLIPPPPNGPKWPKKMANWTSLWCKP